MTEIQRVQVVPKPQDPTWEMLISEWDTGTSLVLAGFLRQARAAAYVIEVFGTAGRDEFAKAVGVGKSHVYEFAGAYGRLLKAYEDHEAASERLESCPLTPWQVVEGLHLGEMRGDIARGLDEVETRKWSVREIKAQRNGHEAGNVETLERMKCPHCLAIFDMKDAEQWTMRVVDVQ